MPSLDQYRTRLEDYSEKFKDFLAFERDDLGVLTVRFHVDGGPSTWGNYNHRAISMAWADIGRDPENEIIVLTGTDGEWLKRGGDWSGSWDAFWTAYAGQLRFWESFVHNIEVPTIGAIASPGPSLHLEPGLSCDITICSDTTVFGDWHFAGNPGGGVPCGDGTGLALEQLIGAKRMAYLVYTNKTIDAQTALDWGVVSEVLPLEGLVPRAQEIAREIIAVADGPQRRLQSQIFKREWKKRLANDWGYHLAHEGLGISYKGPEYTDRLRQGREPFDPSSDHDFV